MIVTGVMNVQAYLLGVWWSSRHPCETGWHLRAAAGVAIHGALVWYFVRGLALSLE